MSMSQTNRTIIVANCENAAGGFGVTPKICDDLFEADLCDGDDMFYAYCGARFV